MVTITISPKTAKNKDLIAISRKEYEILLGAFKILKEKSRITSDDVLRWSKEAKKMKKGGKLSTLRSLKNLR